MYVDEKMCLEVYKGGFKGGEGELNRLLARACDMVDALTHGGARAKWDILTDFQRERVQRAVCLMVDHFTGMDGGVGPVESYSIGDMRVWNRRKKRENPWDVAGCGFLAWSTLMQSGLMKGVL